MVNLPHPTASRLLESLDLRGKTIVVTGSSNGLGLETARALVAKGAGVIGVVRNLEKAHDKTRVIRQAALAGTGSFELVEADLSDLSSVRRGAATILSKGVSVDVLIANAGAITTKHQLTADGLELQLASNFLGHFVLGNRLMPSMRAGSRLIALTSNAHRMGDVDLGDPNFANKDYDMWSGYAAAKTAVALWTVAFDAKYKEKGIRAAAVHPGVIETDLVKNIDLDGFAAKFRSMIEQHSALGFGTFEPKTIEEGAATSIWAAVIADASVIGGKYCEDCGIGEQLVEGQAFSAFSAGYLPHALEPQRANALWQKALELTGESH